MNDGISVVICCYNSVKRIRETLAHLSQQETENWLQWEIILVDNASTDSTVETVKNIKKSNHFVVDLKIVSEPVPGLSSARNKGIKSASYEYIIFCDDDNWLAPDYIQTAFDLMEGHPEIGVIGGKGTAISNIPVPNWFHIASGGYAVGPQAKSSGDITDTRGFVFGAGMVMRKKVILELEKAGFKSLLSDRKGKTLNSGGDSEICYASIIAGYRIWYEEKLQFQHFIPKERLTLSYAFNLFKSFGKSQTVLSIYQFAVYNTDINPHPFFWLKEVIYLIKNHPNILYPKAPKDLSRALQFHLKKSYLMELLRVNGKYDRDMNAVFQLKNKITTV